MGVSSHRKERAGELAGRKRRNLHREREGLCKKTSSHQEIRFVGGGKELNGYKNWMTISGGDWEENYKQSEGLRGRRRRQCGSCKGGR